MSTAEQDGLTSREVAPADMSIRGFHQLFLCLFFYMYIYFLF